MKRVNFTDDLPLHQDADGTIRVKGSRVTFETLIDRFKSGDTPEQIHDGFPSLTLGQIYSAIAWFLNNQTAAEDYLKECNTEANTARQNIESQSDYGAFTEVLRQRREQLIKS